MKMIICPIIMLIINRIDSDMIENNILFISIILMIGRIINIVDLGEKFIKLMFQLFINIKITDIIHIFIVKFKVNMIFLDIEKFIGIRLIIFIIIKVLIRFINFRFVDFFFISFKNLI